MFAVVITEDNVAAGRPTKQSSEANSGASDRATDGNINGDFIRGQSCTHTPELDYPWWAVDLEYEHLVRSVVIYNRADGMCVYFINNS